MLPIVDIWTKAAVENQKIEIVYLKANSCNETLRDVAPFTTDYSSQNLWGHCFLRNNTRCFKPDRIWKWTYIGPSNFKDLQIPPATTREYHDKLLQDYSWEKQSGDDYGYDDFLEFENQLLSYALDVIKSTLYDIGAYESIIERLDQHQISSCRTFDSDVTHLLNLVLIELQNNVDSVDADVIDFINKRISS